MKDGNFEIGDEVICVNAKDREHSLKNGEKYTVIAIYGFNKDAVLINDKHGISTNDTFLASRFKLAEPAFTPEYFSALNEKDAEKYIGKVMEFADRSFMLNNKWTQGEYIGVNTNKNSYCAFKSENSDEIFYQFMRTCPETFKNKMVKKTVERWVNVYQNGAEKTYRYFIDAMADIDDIGCIACIHLTKEYEVEE